MVKINKQAVVTALVVSVAVTWASNQTRLPIVGDVVRRSIGR